jgi:PAS domain S-box-containing protein
MLEAVVCSSPVGVAVLDVDGKVRLWSPASEQILGWTRADVLGRELPGSATDTLLLQQKVIAEGSITDQEIVAVRKDGTEVPIGISAAALHNPAGEAAGAMYLVMDLTERKRAEEALREAVTQAQAANRAKSEFLANMSHEIRTPMNAVLGMLQLVMDGDMSSEQEHYLTVAHGAAESLMGLLSDILDFSRIEFRSLALAPIDFDIRKLLGETAETMALQSQAKGLELTCHLASSLPDLLHGDPLRLRQILTNLLANAVKFTSRGEIGIAAFAESLDANGAKLRFQITDTGIGIDAARADHLFDPFVLGDGSATRKFGGAGLGLAISKQLIEMMGGEIGLESEPGHGSTFWFTASFGQPSQPGAVARALAPDLTNIKTLIVDDSSANRSLVASLLKGWGGQRNRLAYDGPSALEALRNASRAGDPFHLVMVDMTLPGMNGEELGRQISSDPEFAGIPLILMTSPGQRFTTANLRTAGFVTHVWKPVFEASLASAISTALIPAVTPGHAPEAGSDRQDVSWQDRKRILVVEDEVSCRELAVALVQKLGYDADPVNNGVEAITALQNVLYDAVLMDSEMPEMGGCEATAQIRQWSSSAHRSIPIIALTAHARDCDREECIRAGMNDFLTKPVDANELNRVLNRWLGAESSEASIATAETTDAAGVFDAESLLRRLGRNRQLAVLMVKRFLEETPSRVKHLKRRIEDCDGRGVRAQAEALKTSAATVSAVSLSALASAVEDAGASCEFLKAATLLPLLEEQFAQFARFAQDAPWMG